MIEPNELRIGNWVYDGRDNIQVKNIFTEGINHKLEQGIEGKDVVSLTVIPFQYIFPIPITSETLVMLGFHQEDHRWRIPGDSFLLIHEHGSWVNGTPVEPIKYMVYKNGCGAIREVKYLHELQNLYYWIQEKELTTSVNKPASL